MSRGYRNYPGELDFSRFKGTERTPANVAHRGLCRCGAETSRMCETAVSITGWQCRECSEQLLRAQFDKSARKAASGSPEGQK